MQVPVRFLSPNQWGFVCWKTVGYCVFGVNTKKFYQNSKNNKIFNVWKKACHMISIYEKKIYRRVFFTSFCGYATVKNCMTSIMKTK